MKSVYFIQKTYHAFIISRDGNHLFLPNSEVYKLITDILEVADDEFLYRAIKQECESKLEKVQIMRTYYFHATIKTKESVFTYYDVWEVIGPKGVHKTLEEIKQALKEHFGENVQIDIDRFNNVE